jgi:biopolymer transport protein ExbB
MLKEEVKAMKHAWTAKGLVVGLGLMAMVALPVFGQAGGAPAPVDAAAAESDAGIPFERTIDLGVKAVYGVLGLASFLTLTLILYFFVVLRRGQVAPETLRRELLEKVRSGNYDEARRICNFKASPLSAVVLTGLDHAISVPEADPMLLRDAVEAEGARQTESIQGQIQYLMDVAVIAPMLGLLGTVFGMMIAFNAVSSQVAIVRPAELAGGVNKAMLTTALGLLVGIPAMMFHAFFRRRASKLVAILEAVTSDIFTALLVRRRVK